MAFWNTHAPQLQAFDDRKRRINTVLYPPCWHALLTLYREQGLVGLPYESLRTGRWSTWAAGFDLHGQITGLLSRRFDAQDRPWPEKLLSATLAAR